MTANYKPNPGQLKLRETLRQPGITKVLCYSGSRAGKTFELIRALVYRAIQAPKSRHAIIRKHFSLVKKYIWLDTLPEVLDLCFPSIVGTYKVDKTDFFYKFENGSELWCGGLDDKERADRILGGEYNSIFFNECSEVSWHSVSTALTRLAKRSRKVGGDQLINKAYFDCNPPAKSHWSYKYFFENIHPETKLNLPHPDQLAAVHISPQDNIANLSEDFLDELRGLSGAKRKRFYEGLYQDQVQGALWDEDMINRSRRQAPELIRIVVAIDPATTVSATSDETGIIAAGKDKDGHYYILSDVSGFYSPTTWAITAIDLYRQLKADRIVGEGNNGGDMIETILRSINVNISYSKVTATRGKMTRAEPVAALYEQGKVHHVTEFPDLEYELTNYTGSPGEVSPNRLDALVWAVTELMGAKDPVQGLSPETLGRMFY